MARVTVEDCITVVPNRFDLVMVASQRARELSSGAALTVDRNRDKNPVVALREIADKTVQTEALEEALIRSHQKVVQTEEPEEEIVELMAGEQGWVSPDGSTETDLSDMFAGDSEEAGDDESDEDAADDDSGDDGDQE